MGEPREVRILVDGEQAVGALHEPSGNPKGQVVLVHGFLSQRTEFAELGERLAARGWRVLALDQRGFGASGGARGMISQERATADVLAAVGWLRKDAPGLPVGLVGHSMGGAFALSAMAADPDIRAAVLAAPMRTVRAELGSTEFLGYRVAAAVSRAKDRLGMGHLVVPYKNQYEDLFLDAEAARRGRKAAFLSTHVSLANYEALLAMDAEAPARKVRRPVLVLLARHDKAVKHASSRAVYDALAGPKEIATLECGHSLWGDCEAEKAAGHVDRWMGAHLART
jgi:alpha-beta hydrolase superfamily lysophospholipase